MNLKKIVVYMCVSLICLGFISCSFIKPIKSNNLNNENLIPKESLNKIIKENVEPISIKPYFGGKPFCTYEIMGTEKSEDIIKVYLYLLAQEFYIQNNKITKGTGGIFPTVLTIKKENKNYELLKCNISRAEESKEAIKIFPKNLRKKEPNIYFDRSYLEKLEQDAANYFKNKRIIK